MSDWRAAAARLFDIPEESLGSARTIISGKSNIVIEQVSSIIDYTPELVRVRTVCGCTAIYGNHLTIRHLAGTVISISGTICRIEL